MPRQNPPNEDLRQSVHLTEFARLVGISKSTANQWCKEGLPHHRAMEGSRRGRTVTIYLDEALPWLYQWLNACEEGAQEAKAWMDVKLKRLQYARELDELIDASKIAATLDKAIALLNEQLDTLASKHCREFAAETSTGRIRSLLREECRDIRRKFADHLTEFAEYCEDLAFSVTARETVPETNSGPVGESKSKTPTRRTRT